MDGLLFKLFSEFDINGRMWLVIRNLYTGVEAEVLYSGSLSRKFGILQGSGQWRIPAPFMYKVYLDGLLNELTKHSFGLSLNPISTGGGEVFSTPNLFFASNDFVLEPISPKFGNFS